jgi:hypothetical protein
MSAWKVDLSSDFELRRQYNLLRIDAIIKGSYKSTVDECLLRFLLVYK